MKTSPDWIAGLTVVVLAAGCADDQSVVIPFTPVGDQLGWEVVELDQVDQSPEEGDYRLQVEDVIEISVYDETDLLRRMPVRPDGKIAFPLIGEVDVAGRTVESVRAEIARRLEADFLRDAKVTIIVHEFAGLRVSILGEVGSPGVKTLRRNARVIDALAEAGGVRTSQALAGGGGGGDFGPDLDRSYFIRDDRILGVDFYRLVDLGDMSQNILMKEGDLIYIPSTLDNEIYVLGEVAAPSTVRFRNRTSLIEVLAEVGGLRENVTTGAIVIIRDSLREPKAYTVPISAILSGDARDVRLQRGDIVYVYPSALDSLVDVSNKVAQLMELLLTGRQSKAAIQNWSENDRD